MRTFRTTCQFAAVLAAIATLAGCARPAVNPPPENRISIAPLIKARVRTAETIPLVPAVVIVPRNIAVMWEHAPQPNDLYEVWHSTNLRTWSLITNTTEHIYPVTRQLPKEFFRVRTTNTLSHLVSDWATTAKVTP